MTEHDEQVALFGWAEYNEAYYPELRLLYAIPNGGHRHKAVAAELKAEGVKPGVPNLCLPVARMGYHGLYIEMKHGRNKATRNQRDWLDALIIQGYRAVVCWGTEHAVAVLLGYLEEIE